MKHKYPALFKNGSNKDKLNALVTKQNGIDSNSDIDEHAQFVINIKSNHDSEDDDSNEQYAIEGPISRKSGGLGDIGCAKRDMNNTNGGIGVKSASNLANLQ
jgi:hypothetical protein